MRSLSGSKEICNDILALFGQATEKVVTTVGPEQEYFLDRKSTRLNSSHRT